MESIEELVDKIKIFWNTIPSQKPFQKGLSDNEIEVIFNKLDFPIPDEFKLFYKLINGQTDDSNWDTNQLGIFGSSIYFLPLNEESIDMWNYDLETHLDSDICIGPPVHISVGLKRKYNSNKEEPNNKTQKITINQQLDSKSENEDNLDNENTEDSSDSEDSNDIEPSCKYKLCGNIAFGYSYNDECSEGLTLAIFQNCEDKKYYNTVLHLRHDEPEHIVPFGVGIEYLEDELDWTHEQYCNPRDNGFHKWLQCYTNHLINKGINTSNPNELCSSDFFSKNKEPYNTWDLIYHIKGLNSKQKSARK